MKSWQSIIILGLMLSLLLTACEIFPSQQPTSIVSIEDNIEDENGNPIDKSSAPFKVRVRGTVSNAQGLYLYLVVDDGNAQWIQPGLGQNVEGDFEENVYLGIENDPDSLNKQYRIFAVVTDKEHRENEHLDRGRIKASSAEIDLFRKQ